MQLGVFGNITSYIDLPQAAFWLFFVLFVLLCLHLRQNDKREGYPMKASPFSSEPSLGFPVPASPLTYVLNEGGTTATPHLYKQIDVQARPLYAFDGTPLAPVGNPLLAGIGPGSWVLKHDGVAVTEAGEELLQPLRHLPEWTLGKKDADPRGMRVFDWRWNEVGVVHDIWIDLGIKIVRMLEVSLHDGQRVLVPIYHTHIREGVREVRVTALAAHQFAAIPATAHPDSITGREDERLNAYFAAGNFYKGTRLTDPAARPGATP